MPPRKQNNLLAPFYLHAGTTKLSTFSWSLSLQERLRVGQNVRPLTICLRLYRRLFWSVSSLQQLLFSHFHGNTKNTGGVRDCVELSEGVEMLIHVFE